MGFMADAGLSVLGAGLDYLGGSSAARQQYQYQKKLYQHRYRWQVKDMIAAGLNPMLSAGATAPVPGGVQAPEISGIGSKAVSAFNASRMASAQVDNTVQNTQLQKASARQANAEAIRTEYENWKTESDPAFQQVVQAHDPSAPVGTTAFSQEKYKTDLAVIQATAKKAAEDAETARLNREIAQENLTQAQVRSKYADQLGELQRAYNQAMADAARLKIPEAIAEAEFWKNAGIVGKAAIFLKGLFK